MTTQTRVATADAFVFRFTLGPTRWKFWAFDESLTTMRYEFCWSAFTRWPFASVSEIARALTFALSRGSTGLPDAAIGNEAAATAAIATSGRNICTSFLTTSFTRLCALDSSGMKLHKNAKVELIRKIPLFRHCTARELGEIAAITDELDLKEGTELTKEGKPGREFFAIVEGTADVLMGGRWINSLHQGDFLGEIALITGLPRTATVKATSPMRVVVITGQSFRRLLETHPEIQRKVLLSMAERLATAAL